MIMTMRIIKVMYQGDEEANQKHLSPFQISLYKHVCTYQNLFHAVLTKKDFYETFSTTIP